jgi:hypothetical protein
MFIPDPTFFHPRSELSPSRIPDLGSALKKLSILTHKKWFLSSRKYYPGCSSRIPNPDADFYPSWIPDPGVKKAPDPRSGSATLFFVDQTLQFTYSKAGTSKLQKPSFINREHPALQNMTFLNFSTLPDPDSESGSGY